MITAANWWENLSHYNASLFPLGLIVMAIGFLVTIFLFLKPTTLSNLLMKIFLAFINLWNGLVFFIIMGQKLPSPLRFFQGGLFILIGLFFLVDIFTNKTKFQWPKTKPVGIITFSLLLLVALYPIFGLLQGHSYTQLIYPGTVPCATTAFSLIILTTSLPNTSKAPFILLLIWAIPFAPLIQIPQFKVYEDSIIFIVGIYSLIALILSIRKQKKSLS